MESRAGADTRAQGKQHQEVEERGGKWWRRPAASGCQAALILLLLLMVRALVAATKAGSGGRHWSLHWPSSFTSGGWAHSPPGPLPHHPDPADATKGLIFPPVIVGTTSDMIRKIWT